MVMEIVRKIGAFMKLLGLDLLLFGFVGVYVDNYRSIALFWGRSIVFKMDVTLGSSFFFGLCSF